MRKEAFGADVTPEIIESAGYYPVSMMISLMIHPVIWPGCKTKPRLPKRRTAIGQAYRRRSAGLVAAGDGRRESRDCWPAGTPRLRESPSKGINTVPVRRAGELLPSASGPRFVVRVQPCRDVSGVGRTASTNNWSGRGRERICRS